MELDKFIETTLTQIIRGVGAAHDETSNLVSGSVNPKVMNQADGAPKGKNYITQSLDLVQMVDFDVAVTVSSDSNQKGGAGIKIAGLGGFSGDLEKASSSSQVSRLKFQVPITLPSSGS